MVHVSKKYLIAGTLSSVTIFLIVLITIYIQYFRPPSYTTIIHVTVIDKTTKEPIENAIAYLGRGYWKCYTNNNGMCSIKKISYGDYGLGVFKKEYHRFTSSDHFKEGENYRIIEIERTPEILPSFSLKGTVIEVVINKGTRSENRYYKIKDDFGNEEYLFNDIGENQDFEDFINKKVEIRGFKETGFIGWQGERVKGIYVEEIKLLK
jgi:hypothetical protein